MFRFSTKISCCGVWFTLHGVASGGTCQRLHCGRKDDKCWWILVVGLYLHDEYNLNGPLTAPTLLSQSVNVFYICVVSWPVTPRAFMIYNTTTAALALLAHAHHIKIALTDDKWGQGWWPTGPCP